MFNAIPKAVENVVLVGVSVTKIVNALPQNKGLKINVVESDKASYELSREKYKNHDNVGLISEWLLPDSETTYRVHTCNNPRYSSLCEPQTDFFENTNLSYSAEVVDGGIAFDDYLKSLSLSSSTVNLLFINTNGSEYSYINKNLSTLTRIFEYLCVIEPRAGMYNIPSTELESDLYVPISSFEYEKNKVVLYHLDRNKIILLEDCANARDKAADLEEKLAKQEKKCLEIEEEFNKINEQCSLKQKTIDDLKNDQKLYLERELNLQRKYFLLKKCK